MLIKDYWIWICFVKCVESSKIVVQIITHVSFGTKMNVNLGVIKTQVLLK